jgi:hypothetical protein
MPVRSAPHISEPDTIVYGRVVQRLGGHEFLANAGQLVWTVRTKGASPREFQLKAQLRRLAGGQYSYRLSIPHQVQAYDLAVADGQVGLTAGAAGLEHVSATLDGKPLAVSPGAVDAFTLTQASRAGTRQVDFELAAAGPDSDGDGLPDWWEDANGYDKWDPTDAAAVLSPTVVTPPTAITAKTFAEWRSVYYPGDSRSLEEFGADDPDHDGLSNLQEYAFNLNPAQTDALAALSVPHLVQRDGRVGLGYRPRGAATDLTFIIERSEDLFNWHNAQSEVESAVAADGEVGVFEKAESAAGRSFLRVRIVRQ